MTEKKAKREDSVRLRQRGRILSEAGWQKLDEALQQWEVQIDQRRTFEKMAAESALDPGTVAKIFKRKEGADLSKVEQLFRAFQLQVEAIDHCPVPQGMAQSSDPNFVGRAGAIADLNVLVDRGVKVIVIQARGGVGKTTLARKYLQQEFGSFLEFPIAKETKDIASIESLIEEKLKQLGEEPGREFLVSIDRLKRKLQSEAIGILIDNLEPALDSSGKFIEPHRRYVELLRVLSDPSVQSTTLITSRERLYEPSVTVQHYLLNSLDVAAWEQFFQLRQLPADAASLAALHRAYGGNAKAMEIISSAIQTDYSGNIAAYWQANQDDLLIERALEDLVTQQFDRLQQLDLDAYNLLCRMGCYRYQDVPTVPIGGLLCLLWDVAEDRHRRVIKTLQDLSLVEFENGEYWLHPVIRAEAITHLGSKKEWKTSNHKAAEFWTRSTQEIKTIEDAVRMMEAYHHYFESGNYELACEVITNIRGKARNSQQTLGTAFFKMGVLEPMISAIDKIKLKVESEYSLSRLYRILGDLYWAKGDIYQAINYEEIAGDIAKKIGIKWLEVDAFEAIAFCKMELWELENALKYFETLAQMLGNQKDASEFCKYEITAFYCLAFLNSCFDSVETRRKTLKLTAKAYKMLLDTEILSTWREALGFLMLGTAYKNLNKVSASQVMLCRSIELAKKNRYPHIQAKGLSELAGIYCIKQELDIAFLKHSEAIELLKTIGAKCALAEAYHQLGLTYRAIGEVEKSNEKFQEAIWLFTDMKMQKQVDRVRRSMQNNI